MAKQADSNTYTDPDYAAILEEMKEVRAKGIDNADPAGACDLILDLEETVTRIERATTALRLVASTDGIDPEISDAIYVLTHLLEADIQAVQESLEQAGHKLWAFGQGLMNVTRSEVPGQTVGKDILDRMQRFVDQERPRQVEDAADPS